MKHIYQSNNFYDIMTLCTLWQKPCVTILKLGTWYRASTWQCTYLQGLSFLRMLKK